MAQIRTYRELAEMIATLPEGWKDANISVYHAGEDEVYPVQHFLTVPNEDDEEVENDPVAGILDPGHPYLVIADDEAT